MSPSGTQIHHLLCSPPVLWGGSLNKARCPPDKHPSLPGAGLAGGGKDTKWPSPKGPPHRLGPWEQGLPRFARPDSPVVHLIRCEIWKRAPRSVRDEVPPLRAHPSEEGHNYHQAGKDLWKPAHPVLWADTQAGAHKPVSPRCAVGHAVTHLGRGLDPCTMHPPRSAGKQRMGDLVGFWKQPNSWRGKLPTNR